MSVSEIIENNGRNFFLGTLVNLIMSDKCSGAEKVLWGQTNAYLAIIGWRRERPRKECRRENNLPHHFFSWLRNQKRLNGKQRTTRNQEKDFLTNEITKLKHSEEKQRVNWGKAERGSPDEELVWRVAEKFALAEGEWEIFRGSGICAAEMSRRRIYTRMVVEAE